MSRWVDQDDLKRSLQPQPFGDSVSGGMMIFSVVDVLDKNIYECCRSVFVFVIKTL